MSLRKCYMALLAARLPIPGEHALDLCAGSISRLPTGAFAASNLNVLLGSTGTSNIFFQLSWPEFRAWQRDWHRTCTRGLHLRAIPVWKWAHFHRRRVPPHRAPKAAARCLINLLKAPRFRTPSPRPPGKGRLRRMGLVASAKRAVGQFRWSTMGL